MNRTLIIAVAAACVAVGGWLLTNESPSQTTAEPLGAAFAQDSADVDTSIIQEMSIGNPDADVTIIEYASYTCPHCATFHAGNYKQLKSDYIDTGKINFVYREVFFDKFGFWAAIVARCGDGAENRFFGITDMIYEKQREWAARGNTQEEILNQLRTIGKTGGLSDAQLDACFADAETANALYARFQETTEADGINSTPSFVINGTKHSNMTYDEMKNIIEDALGS